MTPPTIVTTALIGQTQQMELWEIDVCLADIVVMSIVDLFDPKVYFEDKELYQWSKKMSQKFRACSPHCVLNFSSNLAPTYCGMEFQFSGRNGNPSMQVLGK